MTVILLKPSMEEFAWIKKYLNYIEKLQIEKGGIVMSGRNRGTLERPQCEESKIGEYKCLVQTKLGWSCDSCLRDELERLADSGVYTVGSCCGHGNNALSTILTSGLKSRKMMESFGYDRADPFYYGYEKFSWRPKTVLPYIKD